MRLLIVFTALAVSAAPAVAGGSFGGFSDSERRYQRGADEICTPATLEGTKVATQPACERADTAAIAAARFRKPARESGADARFRATARQTTLTLRDRGATVVTWTSVDPIEKVTGVYVSPHGAMVAVEFETRFGRRAVTDVVAFRIGKRPGAGAAGAAGDGDDAAATAKLDEGPPAGTDLKALNKHLRKGERFARRYAHKRAIVHYQKALKVDADNSEARYGIARAHAGLRRDAKAIAALEELATSKRGDAIVWLVEARFDKAFKRLLGNKAFRAAVGLDARGDRPLYDRLVGHGGRWEQAATPCENPRVNLELGRMPREFDLRLRDICQGRTSVVNLGGTWKPGGGALQLVFPNPNPKGKPEVVQCHLEACSGDEECLRCPIDRDLELILRVIRR